MAVAGKRVTSMEGEAITYRRTIEEEAATSMAGETVTVLEVEAATIKEKDKT